MLDMHCHEVYMIVLSREHVGRFLKLIPSDHTQDGQIQVKQEDENGVVMKIKGASRLYCMEDRVYLKWIKEGVSARTREEESERVLTIFFPHWWLSYIKLFYLSLTNKTKAELTAIETVKRERERERENLRHKSQERSRERVGEGDCHTMKTHRDILSHTHTPP